MSSQNTQSSDVVKIVIVLCYEVSNFKLQSTFMIIVKGIIQWSFKIPVDNERWIFFCHLFHSINLSLLTEKLKPILRTEKSLFIAIILFYFSSVLCVLFGVSVVMTSFVFFMWHLEFTYALQGKVLLLVFSKRIAWWTIILFTYL